ncbi:ribosome binding protein [Babesia caballi]|uniref:Ribosome binding protein n=1 Tax=Babesia caballi TaxID=5871 RepID=A0AAV4LWG0_BABCB|nr:ribosome binding protein [Babesia caballi]
MTTEKKLTDPPTNLKEAIDWLALVGGGFGGTSWSSWGNRGKSEELEKVLKQLPGFDGVKTTVFGDMFLQGAIKNLADGLGKGFLGYQSQGGYSFSGQGIIKANGEYRSTYENAQWHQDSTELQKCALIFLGSAYVTYYFVTFLYWACSNKYSGPWKGLPLQDDQRPGKYLKPMGFTSTQLNGEKHGTQIAELLDSDFNGFTELKKPSRQTLYSDFLQQLEQQYTKVDWNYPLIACYRLAYRYFNQNKTSPVTQAMEKIKTEFEKLRGVTGKDGQSGGSSDGTEQLADAVTQLLAGVKSSSLELNTKLEAIKEALKADSNNGIIDSLGEGLKKFRDDIHQTKGHQNNVYKELNSHPNLTSESQKCAKIFLGCVPLCFYGLSYLYWRSHDKGAWKDLKLNDRDGSALKNFMAGQGFDTKQLKSGEQGKKVAEALQNFNGFPTAISGVKSLVEFLKKLWPSESSLNPSSHPLSAVFLCASAYFQHQRTTKPIQSPQPPSSIRSMLYWLSGLTMTPQFYSLLDHFSTAVPPGFKVAISGSGGGVGLQTLSADDIAGNLITSCLSSSWVLGTIQGPGETDTPLLHDIYCTSEFSYPSSRSALFSALCDCSYALQFQLLFLYQQCSRATIHGCAWQDCKYGSDVQPHTESHICPSTCNNRHTSGDHNSNCKHTCNGHSPLQAFLTDNLKGFSRPTETNKLIYADHHMAHHPPASMCYVKMGFNTERIKVSNKTGSDIQNTLRPLCGSDVSPFRQLCEKLSCLTKRTPRTLGDVFGFYAQLIDQLFNSRLNIGSLVTNMLVSLQKSNQNLNFTANASLAVDAINENIAQLTSQPPSGLARSLLSIYNDLPFWFQLFMVNGSRDLPLALFDLRQQCHKEGTGNAIIHNGATDSSNSNHNCSSHPGDLWSLFSKVSAAPGGRRTDKHDACRKSNCGGYLFPLSYTKGSTFAPKFAMTYLSWVLYLADDLQNGLQEMLVEFKAVTCGLDSVGHDKSGNCSCHSVVQCGGVLPLLYTNGFNFDTTTLLNGWTKQSGGRNWKHETSLTRSCQKFHSALSNVLSEGAPLHNLLLAIDEFLYYVRFRFMSLVSSFWLCSLLILLYFILYGIDVLHVKSHLHFPSSDGIPPIGLFTTGKAPALTKLTYYMP